VSPAPDVLVPVVFLEDAHDSRPHVPVVVRAGRIIHLDLNEFRLSPEGADRVEQAHPLERTGGVRINRLKVQRQKFATRDASSPTTDKRTGYTTWQARCNYRLVTSVLTRSACGLRRATARASLRECKRKAAVQRSE
jgi:hypothetical protein